MNFGTHLKVAHEVAPRLAADNMAEFGLGAMLPDFIAMSGSRVDRAVVSGRQTPLTRGIKFHHRTDGVFHSLPGFTELRSAVQYDIAPLATSPHQARAWSEVGIELLIDGQEFQNRDLRRHYKESMALALNQYSVLRVGAVAIRGERFIEWLAACAEHGVPNYETPAVVVRALYRRLMEKDMSRRAGSNVRLGFDNEQGRAITEVFQSHLDTIHKAGQELVRHTVEKLLSPEPTFTRLEPVDPDSVRPHTRAKMRAKRRF